MDNNIKVSHSNLGTINQNCVTIETDRGSIDLYFSYKTLVAVNGFVSENIWSKTTGKLLNYLQPDKDKRVSHEEVLKEADKKLKSVLYPVKLLVAEEL